MMIHPERDELAGFLYDDGLEPSRRDTIAQHVESCDACQAQLAAWRGVCSSLAAWDIPDARRAAVAQRPAQRTGGAAQAGLRWAVAAAVLLGTGFGVARMTEKPVDLTALRADLVRDVRREVREELSSELTNHSVQQVQWQQSFQQAVAEAIGQLDARQANLRKDLETVALGTEEQFGRLAGVAQGAQEQPAPQATPVAQ